MKVSLNTVRQFTSVDLTTETLVTKINQQLGHVEEVIDLGRRYEGATIARVVTCEKHENADKLSVCKIDAGTGETIQVVCGAPNVREGLWVVWLKPGSTVPATQGDKEPFVLEARELRGVVSNGMLASGKELGISDDHSGIVEINPDEWHPSGLKVEAGASFAQVFGLDDTIIDIENKMFTHRPDLFGQLGVAREIAGITHNSFTSPDWYKVLPNFNRGEGLELSVKNDASEVVPRFMAVAVKDVEIKPSPLWLQCALTAMGGKPINNVVDVTNYVMLLTAQPTHAYDYDKLRGHFLGTRMGMKGEQLPLLNGKTYTLDETDIVIVDGEGPVGLAGIMGGGNSEVSAETKNIVLEVANFDMYAVRKSSMKHGLFTDALTRFNKGQSVHQNPYVLDLLMKSLFDVAGGAQATDVFDESAFDTQLPVVETSVSFVNERLGLQLSKEEMATLLRNVEFEISEDAGLQCKVPFWRTDVELAEDVVEEVGRLYGFESLPRELPLRTTAPAAKNVKREVQSMIRRALSRAGGNEVLTYSFVHENVMKRAEQDVSQAFGLSNALSPDLQYYRLSVLPSLLDRVHANIKSGHDEFVLFEIGKGHNKKYHADDDDGLPTELEFVDAVYASKKPRPGAAFFQIRRLLDALADEFGVQFVYKKIEQPLDFPVTAPFDQSRSAMVETAGGVFIGMIGELKQSVQRAFKLPAYSAAMTLDQQGLIDARKEVGSYTPLSRFPSVTQDISLRVASGVAFGDVFAAAQEALQNAQPDQTSMTLSTLGIYEPEQADSKTITLRLKVASYEKTLTDADVAAFLEVIASAAQSKTGAVRA